MAKNSNFKSILLVGLGLIGGSIIKCLKRNKFKGKVFGFDLNEEVVKKAFDQGLLENRNNNLKKIDCDSLLIFSVPSLDIENAFNSVSKFIDNKTLYTDTLSSKSELVSFLDKNEDIKRNFIMSHPIAGSEKSGLSNSDPNLFEEKLVVISPSEKLQEEEKVERIKNFWKYLGARVSLLPADEHEKIFAHTSHLPHIVTYCLMNYLFESLEEETFTYSGGSLEGYTRIASSNSKMWKDIMISNKEEVLKAINGFKLKLDFTSDLIKTENQESLEKYFNSIKETRDNLLNQKS